jgi:ATP-dependent Clp protease protease subunit
MTMHRYESVLDGYINPTILEERKMNVASMDVFSRLMMDRIIFLGVPIDDDVANIITAQLLFLASNDSTADISLYMSYLSSFQKSCIIIISQGLLQNNINSKTFSV